MDEIISGSGGGAWGTITGTLSSQTDLNDALALKLAIAYNPAVADHAYDGKTETGTAGENLTIGQVCYLKSDGKYWKAKGDVATTMPCVAMATGTINADATGVFLIEGYIRDDSWGAMTVGSPAPVYVSAATAGAFSQTAPSTVGHQAQVIGYAYAAKVLFFRPDITVAEVGTDTSLDPTLADHAYNGHAFTATAGENLVLGDVCYMKSDGKYWKADASATSTMPGVVMATASISADASGVFLQKGFIRNDDGWGGALTVGGLLYTSGTAGGPTQTAPAVSGDQVQVVGYAYAARIVFFDPSLVMVEVP